MKWLKGWLTTLLERLAYKLFVSEEDLIAAVMNEPEETRSAIVPAAAETVSRA